MSLDLSLTQADLINGMSATAVLLAKFFGYALYRRHSLASRTSREAAENLWHVRQLTAELFGDSANRSARLNAGVAKAPLDVVLHLLRMHVGSPRQDLLDACEAVAKFRGMSSDLGSRDPRKAIRALELIEVCQTPSCIAAVRCAMVAGGNGHVQLAAAWSLQRMDPDVRVEEIAAVLSGLGSANPPIRDAVERDLAQRYTGSVDALLATFARLGSGPAGIRLLGKLKTDDAIWHLLLLAGQRDNPTQSALASQTLASEASAGRRRLQPSVLETQREYPRGSTAYAAGVPILSAAGTAMVRA